MDIIKAMTELKDIGLHCSLQTHTNGIGAPVSFWLFSIETEDEKVYREGVGETPEKALGNAVFAYNHYFGVDVISLAIQK